MGRSLRQLDQDLVVVPVQPVRVQVAVELAQEQLGQVHRGPPGLLLVWAQPARLSVGPGHNMNLPLSREYGDIVPAGRVLGVLGSWGSLGSRGRDGRALLKAAGRPAPPQ